MFCRRLLPAVIVILCANCPAYATSITLGGTVVANEGQVSSVAGATTVNFNALPLFGPQNVTVGIASYSNLFVFGNDPGDILNDTSRFADPNGPLVVNTPLTIDFSSPISYFGLYWGSPDPANLISFFNGGTLLFNFTGQNLHDQLGVGFGLGSAAYVNFRAAAGESYTRIVISANGSFPFEDDNHAFLQAVPEPASFILLGSGLVGAGVTRWRRRRTAA
jgi:hypothetical protein